MSETTKAALWVFRFAACSSAGASVGLFAIDGQWAPAMAMASMCFAMLFAFAVLDEIHWKVMRQ